MTENKTRSTDTKRDTDKNQDKAHSKATLKTRVTNTIRNTRGRPRGSGSNSVRPTKDRIFEAAVKLFSDSGYSKVSMRDIAQATDISVAAIYNHFPSKDAILVEMHDFYKQHQKQCWPDMDMLLALCETEPPIDVLMKIDFRYSPQIEEIMDRIVIVAAVESRADERNAIFLRENILDLSYKLAGPLLNRLIELERIEPLDIDGLLILLSNFSFSAALRNHSIHHITLEDWQRGIKVVFSLIKTTGK